MNAAYDHFQRTVLAYYHVYGRHDLPWRRADQNGTFDPYKVLISEMMLQQTQVVRVIPKFATFLQKFPTVQILAAAPLGTVLIAWQGLGYNRRAKFLWEAARIVIADCGGIFPRTHRALDDLPGVGSNTAGAIMAYAYNEPSVFIETNIRTVYIHHFFHDQTDVPDADIIALVARTLPTHGHGSIPTRVWYWALMDYGTYLKQSVGNVSRASKTYMKQSVFIGSKRQLRGKVLYILANGAMTAAQLKAKFDDERTMPVLDELVAEGMLQVRREMYELP